MESISKKSAIYAYFLVGDGFVADNEVTDSKIRITYEGKKRLENNQI
jgi:hypothetical protein